jgi:hypothetical protein
MPIYKLKIKNKKKKKNQREKQHLIGLKGFTFRDFCFISPIIPKTESVKKLKWAPIVYCFRIGKSQTFASDRSSASKLRGRRPKKVSGPNAPRADPRHSCSCILVNQNVNA